MKIISSRIQYKNVNSRLRISISSIINMLLRPSSYLRSHHGYQKVPTCFLAWWDHLLLSLWLVEWLAYSPTMLDIWGSIPGSGNIFLHFDVKVISLRIQYTNVNTRPKISISSIINLMQCNTNASYS